MVNINVLQPFLETFLYFHIFPHVLLHIAETFYHHLKVHCFPHMPRQNLLIIICFTLDNVPETVTNVHRACCLIMFRKWSYLSSPYTSFKCLIFTVTVHSDLICKWVFLIMFYIYRLIFSYCWSHASNSFSEIIRHILVLFFLILGK